MDYWWIIEKYIGCMENVFYKEFYLWIVWLLILVCLMCKLVLIKLCNWCWVIIFVDFGVLIKMCNWFEIIIIMEFCIVLSRGRKMVDDMYEFVVKDERKCVEVVKDM